MLLLLPLRILLPRITILLGVFLVLLGLWGFFVGGMEKESLTALIPAAFGLVFGLLGMVSAANHRHRPLMMRIASVIALLAIVGTASGVPAAVAAMKGETVGVGAGGPAAAYAKSLMFAASALYLLINLYAFGSAKQKLAADEAEG